MNILYLIGISLIVFAGIVLYKFRNEIRALVRAKMEERKLLSQLRKEMLLKAKIKALQELEPELVQQMKEKELERMSGDKLSKGMEKFAKMLGTGGTGGTRVQDKLAKMGVGRTNNFGSNLGNVFNKDKLNQMLGKSNTSHDIESYDNTAYEQQAFPVREMPQHQDVKHQDVRYNQPLHGQPQRGNPQRGNPQRGNPQRGNPQRGPTQRPRYQSTPQTEQQGPNVKELVGVKKPNMEKLMGNFNVGKTLRPEEKLKRLLRK